MATDSIITDRDLVAALAIAISQHPQVKAAQIYAPGNAIDPVEIAKIKLYGGEELTEPGLVLAIYPDKVNLGNRMTGFIQETPLSIAHNHVEGAAYGIVAHFVLQLSYRVTDFDTPIELKFARVTQDNHSYAPSDSILFNPDDYQYLSGATASYQIEQIPVVVLPAEEVLRDWITLFRYVIRDIRYLKPYAIRSPQILSVEYDTTKIFEKGAVQNLVFHTASIHFKLTYSEGNFER